MVSAVETIINNNDPVLQAYEKEYSHMFLAFCSFVCIIKNKKMNLANIFLWLMREPELREIFKALCEVETDYDVLKCFLEYEPSLHRSKYIRNFLQDNPKLNLKI